MKLLNFLGGQTRKDTKIRKLEYEIKYLEKYKKDYKNKRNDVNKNMFDLGFKPDFGCKLNLFLNKLFKKKKLNVIFIKDNKEVCLKYIFYNNKNYFKIADKSYTFTESDFYTHQGSPTLFIYENQPMPCTFKNNSKIDSKILKEVIESNFISQILSRDDGILGMGVNKNMVTIILMILAFMFLMSQGFFNDMFTN